MKYNRNNLFGVKGRIGELVHANYMKYSKAIECIEATAEEQKRGLDFYMVSGNLKQGVDVKLSDKLDDYFVYTWANGNNARHPNRFDSALDRIMVVTYNWELYVTENSVKLKNKTSEDIKQALLKYVNDKELEELIRAIEKKQKKADDVILQELKELYIAHRTCDRLEKEFNNPKEQEFKDTKRLFEKQYVRSIKSVPALLLSNLTYFMKNNPPDSHTVGDATGPLVRKKTYWTRFGPIIVAEVYWRAVSNDVEVYYELEKQPSDPVINFGKYEGTAVKDLTTGYLSWLCTEAKKPGPMLGVFQKELAKRKGSTTNITASNSNNAR